MSDNPGVGFALGFLAAGPIADTASQGALMLTRALRTRQLPSYDVSTLVQTIVEQEEHIVQQDNAIDQLRRSVADWQEYARKVEAQRSRLQEYADWAEAELKRRSGEI